MAQQADVMIIVGTAGQVMPACSLPLAAKEHGCKIIEVNPRESSYTGHITDLYFPQFATQFFGELAKELDL